MSDLSVLLGVISSFFSALNGVQIKQTLLSLANKLGEINYLINLISSVVLVPFIYLFNEHENIIRFHGLFHIHFWFILISSGLLGFLLGLSVTFQIQVTSPLTANISGIKNFIT